jgi:hypothetical protein
VRVNGGTDMQAAEIGGGGYGFAGTATATSATSLTATGTPFVTNAFVGQMVCAGGAYGVILSNTTSVLTVDQWYNPASPGGAATTTPGATTTYVIVPGQAPAMFMALTLNSSAAVATDTALTGELATAGSGLIRKIAAWAHTATATTYTMAATFTATATDQATGSQAVAKGGMFNSIKASTGIMQFETLLNAPATLVVTGDQTTITQTVTM